ncbi:hypothetical protein ARC78_11420 [Stenotrophomonas pictorum JCM 9942]|uniref:Uncharacterized protein n=1 Tax=Stenotrophomonas pictorum JCM 9942 TaxID=1236960 RepID=A0A0R0AKY0_9GAMM|nr:hypothetical protein [Stenotrophomonas pictorum]KRG41352.1 hypothetical protein ARC78_11420 [Stenotrophomonas pictorum JCM 9942]
MKPVASARLLLATLLALTTAPVLAASQCAAVVGEGWPPAVANYGDAAAQLLGGVTEEGLSLLSLPARGPESQVQLRREPGSGQWVVVAGLADKRIYSWNSGSSRAGVNLRLDQQPELAQAPVPDALAQRLLQVWAAALASSEVAPRAPVTDGEVVSFTLNGARYSGLRPGCGRLEALLDQAALLVELAHSKDKKHEKRYADIERALDKMHDRFSGDAG